MQNISTGLLAGLVATVALSAMMIVQGMLGVMPGLNVAAMVGAMIGSSTAVGWIIHFLVHTIVGGVGFAVLFDLIPGGSASVKGIVYGIAAWLILMFIIMPMAGVGIFGLELGVMAPVMVLVLHIIFGAVLGLVYQMRAKGSA
ncbi:MAG: hypothetical protein O3A51_00605 [Verrucomicrobia bacterium]|nr:hypothetical protein [Verrucomicrobiota bacterium]